MYSEISLKNSRTPCPKGSTPSYGHNSFPFEGHQCVGIFIACNECHTPLFRMVQMVRVTVKLVEVSYD
jgi:hypothetical protein